MKCSLGISNFLEEISSLSHSIVFLYLFALIAEEGFLISLCYSLELYIQMAIFTFLLCFSLPFFSQLFVRPPQTAILLCCVYFSWRWSWFLPPVQYHKISVCLKYFRGFPGVSVVKIPPAKGGMDSISGLGRSSGEGNATHSSILAGKFHGQRSLEGYSPWSHKESEDWLSN